MTIVITILWFWSCTVNNTTKVIRECRVKTKNKREMQTTFCANITNKAPKLVTTPLQFSSVGTKRNKNILINTYNGVS